jgi:hypothetical protein
MSDEDDAMERWNLAWQRHQDAMTELNKHWYPKGSGVIPQKALDDVESTKKEVDAAKAQIDRIVAEIRSGKRRLSR